MMIIIDGEDQSSLMLSDASINADPDSSSLCFKLYPLTDLAVSPAYLVFSLRLRLLELFRLAGVSIPDEGFERWWIELALSERANKNLRNSFRQNGNRI